jgi:hypothetical protein
MQRGEPRVAGGRWLRAALASKWHRRIVQIARFFSKGGRRQVFSTIHAAAVAGDILL